MDFLGGYRRHCNIDYAGVSTLKQIARGQILAIPPSKTLGKLTDILAC